MGKDIRSGLDTDYKAGYGDKEPEKPASKQQKQQSKDEKYQ